MDKPGEYLGLLVAFFAAAAVAGIILLLNRLLGPKHPMTAEKAEPFECGMTPALERRPALSLKFYLMAMLFILFDVEIVWLFPWAVALRELGWTGIVGMLSFLFVLVLGYAYAWKSGVLEWER